MATIVHKPVLRIPRWWDFQHYKDRTAPWIKVYRELLLDDEWQELSDTSKAHLVGLWLLAPNYDGKIPFKPSWIAQKIGASSPIDWLELTRSKWVALNPSASGVLAELYNDDSLRALAREEGEESREEGEETRASSSKQKASEVPEDYAPPADLVSKAAKEFSLAPAEIQAQTQRFVAHHRAKGSTFKRHDLAWWNWVSNRFVTPRSTLQPPQQRTIKLPPRKAE